MWPTFIAVTLLDGLIMWQLPPIGTGVDPVPAILIATFGNLVLIGAVAPWLARRIWKRRPSAEPGAPPRAQLEVLTDRIGTGLLLATVVGVIAAGLAAKPLVVVETKARERAAEALSRRVAAGTPELQRNVDASNTRRLADGYFRTCIPNDDRDGWTCFFVDVRRVPGEGDQGPERDPEPATLVRRERPQAAVWQHLEHVDLVAAAAQRSLRDQDGEELASLEPEVEAASHCLDPPVHRNSHVAVLVEWNAAERPGHSSRQQRVVRVHVLHEGGVCDHSAYILLTMNSER